MFELSSLRMNMHRWKYTSFKVVSTSPDSSFFQMDNCSLQSCFKGWTSFSTNFQFHVHILFNSNIFLLRAFQKLVLIRSHSEKMSFRSLPSALFQSATRPFEVFMKWLFMLISAKNMCERRRRRARSVFTSSCSCFRIHQTIFWYDPQDLRNSAPLKQIRNDFSLSWY